MSNIMKFSGKWVEREKVILSDITQTKKFKCVKYSFIVDINWKDKGSHDTIHIPVETK